MDFRIITDDQKEEYNDLVTHVMQSWEWGEFRKSIDTPLLRYGLYKSNKLTSVFQITLHKIPFIEKYVGYLPKGPFPDEELAGVLKKVGKENNCAFIKIEPDVIASIAKQPGSEKEIAASPAKRDPRNDNMLDKNFLPSPKPLFTKYNFIIDLTKSEDQLLKDMHPKTRYNIRIAQKHNVKIEERIDDEAFEIYKKLYFETTKRQNYHGHTPSYHKSVWEALKKHKMARLLIAYYQPPATNYKLPLTAWMLINFKDTLYYPYGGSSKEYPEVMANNLIAWEAIKLGKKLDLKNFDMWGALGPNADPKDPWFGFHRFKKGYGGKLVEYIGTYDLVLDWPLYILFTFIDKFTPLKIFLLKLLGK